MINKTTLNPQASVYSKGVIKAEKQPSNSDKIFPINTFDTGFIYRIYKETYKSIWKKKNSQIYLKSGQNN